MSADSLLGPIPGVILLLGIVIGGFFYFLNDPETHPTLGRKIVKGDPAFDRLKSAGYPVHTARYSIAEDREAPSTRTLYLYFKAQGFLPENDAYEYIALPPTRRDWMIEFSLWWIVPLLAALYTLGASVAKLVGIVLFLYLVAALVFVLVYLPATFLFGNLIGMVFYLLALGVAVILIATRYRNTDLVQRVF